MTSAANTTPVRVTLHGRLDGFLTPHQRGHPVQRDIPRHVTLKDLIESLGVPHTEVAVLLADGRSVGFDLPATQVQQLDVFPVGAPFPLPDPIALRPRLQHIRFIVDANLGRLARNLRMLGFDTWYRNDYDDAELARIAARHHRLLLTRDRQLLKRGCVIHGSFVHATQPYAQVHEVLDRFGLQNQIRPFDRCNRCNGRVERIDKAEIAQRLPPRTRASCDEFWQCASCGQPYWEGAHFRNLRQMIDGFSQSAAD